MELNFMWLAIGIIALNLSKEEVKDLLLKYPDAPKVVLNGKTYFPSIQFQEWFSTIKFNK